MECGRERSAQLAIAPFFPITSTIAYWKLQMKVRNLLEPSDANMVADVTARLAQAGLRATLPRLVLGKLLFGGPNRHVSAEKLYNEAQAGRPRPSLATVYNTLRQFRRVGLLREIAVEGQRSYFDTRTGPHFHYLDESTGELFDASDDIVTIGCAVTAPPGFEVAEIQIVVRLRPTKPENPVTLATPAIKAVERNRDSQG
jgi:Fur family transcriptional regulator, iron response regulator